jgi:hypothetical protein
MLASIFRVIIERHSAERHYWNQSEVSSPLGRIFAAEEASWTSCWTGSGRSDASRAFGGLLDAWPPRLLRRRPLSKSGAGSHGFAADATADAPTQRAPIDCKVGANG